MSASRSFEYIELNRSFRRLLEEAYKDDNQRFDLSVAQGSSLPWDELLKLHRVVILSEAGSGKTMEIREISYRLRDEEKSAFFLRLENISNGLEDAFEVGSYEEFCEWLTTSQQAWLFLDSVDECRLKDPKDFERAIRVVGKELRQREPESISFSQAAPMLGGRFRIVECAKHIYRSWQGRRDAEPRMRKMLNY